jgi:hypothetical protein
MADKKFKRGVRNASYQLEARRRYLKVLLRELEDTAEPGEVFALSQEVISLAEQVHRIGIRLEAGAFQAGGRSLRGTVEYLSQS